MVMTFNKSALAKAVGKVNANYLFLAGSSLRSTAKRSLKVGKTTNGKRQHSTPNNVPYVWSSSSPLKNLLFFALDQYSNSMVVGSAISSNSGKKPAPGILEYGGVVDIKVREYQPLKKRKWGPKHYEGTRPRLKSGKGDYTYFRSTSAWERASESSSFQQWGRAQNPKYHTEQVRIEPRPYMQKALRQICSASYSAYLYKKAVQRSN